MKKCCYATGMFLLVLAALCGCQKSLLPQHEFPLEADAVTSALRSAGLAWVITDEQSWSEGHTVYTLCNEAGQMTANVSSANADGRRQLFVGFLTPDRQNFSNIAPLTEPDWEKAFQFCTLLYGGYENSGQVFKAFSRDISSTLAKEPDTAGWEWSVDLCDIQVSVVITQDQSDPSKKYLKRLDFISDVAGSNMMDLPEYS